MLNFVVMCLNELNEVNECWIERNTFGDTFEELKDIVCMTLDRIGYQYEIAEFGGNSYTIRIVQ